MVKVLTKLDEEMSTILHNNTLDEIDKAKLYSQTLQQYLSMRKNLETPNPKTPNVQLPNQTETNVYKNETILNTIPKKFHKQAGNLLNFISTTNKIKWGDDGLVSIDDVPIKGSNIVDLINDTLRNRKTFQPHGWQNFSTALHDMNVPSELIGNPHRRSDSMPLPSSLHTKKTSGVRKTPALVGGKKSSTVRWRRY